MYLHYSCPSDNSVAAHTCEVPDPCLVSPCLHGASCHGVTTLDSAHATNVPGYNLPKAYQSPRLVCHCTGQHFGTYCEWGGSALHDSASNTLLIIAGVVSGLIFAGELRNVKFRNRICKKIVLWKQIPVVSMLYIRCS